MVFEPNGGNGYEFTNEIIGGAVPKEYIPGRADRVADVYMGVD